MNVLLLGNGFDLYHKLPTKYHNFLHVTETLISNESERFLCAGDVFALINVKQNDEFISKCYSSHKEVYDELNLEVDLQTRIINLCKENWWFHYFSDTFDKDAGWIDFEKEIAHVLRAFKKFLDNADVKFSLNAIFEKEGDLSYIISYFDFFYEDNTDYGDMGVYQKRIIGEYITENPTNSGNYIIDQQKVVSFLLEQLENVAKALQLYLMAFVENAVSLMKDRSNYKTCDALVDIDHTVTFNYTDTYNMLYSDNSTYYLHGNVSDEIILGINPDEYDEPGSIDTLLVRFKKYFQRNLLDTDVSFWRWLGAFRRSGKKSVLLIMGHSLDITDEDIIKELINDAKRIYVFYHDRDAKIQYITNLVGIFGKTEFDQIRHNKKLEFVPLASDFKQLKQVLYDNSYAREREKAAAFRKQFQDLI